MEILNEFKWAGAEKPRPSRDSRPSELNKRQWTRTSTQAESENVSWSV